MTLDVAACFEPSGRPSAPALRSDIPTIFVKLNWVPAHDGAAETGISASVDTGALVTRHGPCPGDLDMVAQGYVGELPVPALGPLSAVPPWSFSEDGSSLVPSSVFGMVSRL